MNQSSAAAALPSVNETTHSNLNDRSDVLLKIYKQPHTPVKTTCKHAKDWFTVHNLAWYYQSHRIKNGSVPIANLSFYRNICYRKKEAENWDEIKVRLAKCHSIRCNMYGEHGHIVLKRNLCKSFETTFVFSLIRFIFFFFASMYEAAMIIMLGIKSWKD